MALALFGSRVSTIMGPEETVDVRRNFLAEGPAVLSSDWPAM